MVACLHDAASGYDAGQTRPAAAAVPIDPAPVNMYRAEIEEFSQAVLDGREPANNARIGLQSQRLLAACYESARTGSRINLTPTP